MDDMLKKYGNMTAKQLVNLTHAKGSLWYKVAEQNGSEYAKETAEKLLSELSDEDKLQAYKIADEYIIKYGKAQVH